MPIKKLALMLIFCVSIGAGIPIVLAKFGLIPRKTVEVTRMLPDENKKAEKAPETVVSDRKEGAAPLPVYATALQAKPTDNAPEKPLYVRGYIWLGQQVRVLLSDGRTLSQRDKILKQVDSTGITLNDGTRLWMETIRPKEQAQLASITEPKKEPVDDSHPPARSAEIFSEAVVPLSPTAPESPSVLQSHTTQFVPRGTSSAKSNMRVTTQKKS